MISFWNELGGMKKWQHQALCTPSRQGDRNSTPQISQEWTYYSSLPLPRVWQVQAHVPTCFYSFCCLLLISTHTMNSPLFLTADVTSLHDFWTRTTSPRSLPPCLDATCLSLQGDTEPCSPSLRDPEACHVSPSHKAPVSSGADLRLSLAP